jgi:hypothetical protein
MDDVGLDGASTWLDSMSDLQSDNTSAPVLDPTMLDLLSPGSSAMFTRSLDDLPGPEREPDIKPYTEEPMAHIKRLPTEPAPHIIEEIDTIKETEDVDKPVSTTDKYSGDLFLSPCISSFYLEILAGVGLAVFAIWVNITTDFGDETINRWLAEPGFIEDLSKTVAVIIVGLLFRFVFIYAMFSYTFENEIIKTRKGIFSRDADSINVRHVRKQFFSSGSAGEDVVFQRIKDPAKIREYIESFRED